MSKNKKLSLEKVNGFKKLDEKYSEAMISEFLSCIVSNWLYNSTGREGQRISDMMLSSFISLLSFTDL